MFRLMMACALLATAAQAGSQTIITEDEFLSVLGPGHPALAESAADLAIARASLVDRSALENPAIQVVREDPTGDGSQIDLMFSWKLPDANRGLLVEAAEHEVRAAEAGLAQALLSIRLEMREVYAAWAVASVRATRLSAQFERIESLARREEVRAERGESSGLEAHRLRLAASGLAARLALARADEVEARARARAWNDQLPSDPKPVLPDLPQLRMDFAAHPLIVAAEAELAAAEASRKASGRFIRSPELMGGWQRQETGGTSVDGPLLGVSWSIPLFRRNQAERLVADARVRAAEGTLERVRREVSTRREAASARYTSLAESVAMLASASTANERMVRGTEAAFLHGEATLTDLLEMLRSATEADLALLELHEAALEALRDIERLEGGAREPRPSGDMARP